jgi:hypothetical protein
MAVLLLAMALGATGCGDRTASPPDATAGADLPTVSPELAVIDPADQAGLTTQTTTQATATTPQTTSNATAMTPTTQPADPAVDVDVDVNEIDQLLAGLDETFAELDQLLNQAAAALAAEEGEILP